MDLETLKLKTKEITEKINNLQRGNEILEGKYNFLDYCHTELGNKNQKIRKNLTQLTEKEKNLENLFFYVIRNFFPNLKFNENTLPDNNNNNNNNNNNVSNLTNNNEQIIDISKNEIINHIYKQLQNLYLKNGNNNYNLENIMKDASKQKVNQLIDYLSKNNNNNIETQNDIQYFSQIKNFQEKYLNDLDETYNNSNNNNINNKIIKFDNNTNNDFLNNFFKYKENKEKEKENIYNNNNKMLINNSINNSLYNKNFLNNKRERDFSNNNTTSNNNNNNNNNSNIVKDNSYMSLSTDKKESIDSDGLRDLM